MAKLLRVAFILLLLTGPGVSQAQHTIILKKLWVAPQVAVKFGEYHILFTIKDIEKTIQLLPNNVRALYGGSSELDSNRTYSIELMPGRSMEYRFPLQRMMQNDVGGFLLLKGHACIVKGRKKTLHSINIKIGPPIDMDGYATVSVTVYDPKDNAMIFSGVMNAAMYYKDLGLD